ncbi:MAG: EF2563 family selenium-dependent molybdenum hydroxylase system protein [Desulfobacteraceae bacterium]|nr:EF2563 family selenium-dependent molybdenum hydroxylase system protein [Desulfobacteraceae bacterium]
MKHTTISDTHHCPKAQSTLADLSICIKGAGDIATGVAVRLHRCGLTRIVMLETEAPLSVRRSVCFSEAIFFKEKIVEGIMAVAIDNSGQISSAWNTGRIPVLADPDWKVLQHTRFDVVVDAIIAKKNLGARIQDGRLVIGLGPGFIAGIDVHRVIETNRGHDLGRVIRAGQAQPNTGVPGIIMGYDRQRLLRAPADGEFVTGLDIGDIIENGQPVGNIGDNTVRAQLGGVIRGLLHSGTQVRKGTKLGDIDPRKNIPNCNLISDKALAVAGGVLEAIMETHLA